MDIVLPRRPRRLRRAVFVAAGIAAPLIATLGVGSRPPAVKRTRGVRAKAAGDGEGSRAMDGSDEALVKLEDFGKVFATRETETEA